MTRIPDHGWKEAVRILKAHGFRLLREKGDHMAFGKEGIARPVVVPKYDSLPRYIIDNIIKTAKIARKTYVDELCGGKRRRGGRALN